MRWRLISTSNWSWNRTRTGRFRGMPFFSSDSRGMLDSSICHEDTMARKTNAVIYLILALPMLSVAQKEKEDVEKVCRERLARLAGGVKVYRLIHDGKS